jgi:hypothetical protein
MATNNISKGKPKMFIFTPTNCRLRLDQIEHEEDAVCQEANVKCLITGIVAVAGTAALSDAFNNGFSLLI